MTKPPKSNNITPCPNCGNTKFFIEDGHVACKCGRLQKTQNGKAPTLQERIEWWTR